MPKSAAICLSLWPGSRLRATRTISSRNSLEYGFGTVTSFQRHLSAPQIGCHLSVQQAHLTT